MTIHSQSEHEKNEAVKKNRIRKSNFLEFNKAVPNQRSVILDKLYLYSLWEKYQSNLLSFRRKTIKLYSIRENSSNHQHLIAFHQLFCTKPLKILNKWWCNYSCFLERRYLKLYRNRQTKKDDGSEKGTLRLLMNRRGHGEMCWKLRSMG